MLRVRIVGRRLCSPIAWKNYVTQDYSIRLIKVFIDELNLAALGFAGAVPEVTGRRSARPAHSSWCCGHMSPPGLAMAEKPSITRPVSEGGRTALLRSTQTPKKRSKRTQSPRSRNLTGEKCGLPFFLLFQRN